MLKKHKWSILLSNLLILLPMVAGLVFWDQLPKEAESFKQFTVLWMPVIMLALQWLAILFTCMDKKNKEQSPKVVGLVLWMIPVIHLFTCGVMYMAMRGGSGNLFGITMLPLGVLFVIIGNYMPKCKQNSTIGVKIKWTLESEENWNATHRVAGKTWTACGFAFLMVVFLPLKWAVAALFGIIAVMILIPTIYSYRFYKKELAAGKDMKQYQHTKTEKVARNVALITVPIVLILCCVLMFTGDVNVSCGDTSMKIEADYYEDRTVSYQQIQKIEYREKDMTGSRLYGYGSPRLQLGSFSNDEFGTYTRYTCGDGNGCVVLWLEDEILVVSGKTPTETREIYETLVGKGVG